MKIVDKREYSFSHADIREMIARKVQEASGRPVSTDMVNVRPFQTSTHGPMYFSALVTLSEDVSND